MSFRLVSVRFDGNMIPFASDNSDPSDSERNACTILIGRNGVGKSRLLAEICYAFAAFDNSIQFARTQSSARRDQKPQPEIELTYAVNQDRITIKTDNAQGVSFAHGQQRGEPPTRPALPRRVIATTITPSDKFPTPDRMRAWGERLDKSPGHQEPIYRYLGGKGNLDSISMRRRLSRVAAALLRSTEKSDVAREKMANVFRLLSYHPHVDVHYDLRVPSQELEN